MKKVNIVLIVVLIVFVNLSCGRQQPEEAAEPAGTEIPAVADEPIPAEAEKLTDPWPEPEEEITAEAEAEPDAALPVQPPSEAPASSDEPFSQPPDPSEITKISVAEAFVAAAKPESAPEAETEPSQRAAAVSIAPQFLTGIQGPDDGIRNVIITSPDVISYYESSVNVSGYFSGFPDITAAGWELKGTGRMGELLLENNFDFEIDTKGLTETQAVRIFAEDSTGKTAEGLFILVNDGFGPEILITSPSNNAVYNSETTIKGIISGDLKEAVIEVLGSLTQIPVEINPDGRFSLQLKTFIDFNAEPDALPYNPVLKLTAEDNNQNISTEYLSLFSRSPGSGITITSPREGDLFDTGITIDGKTETLRELSWDIPDTGFSGMLAVEDGVFSYPLQLSGLNDRIILRLSGESDGITETTTIRMSGSGKAPDINISEPSDGGYYTGLIPLKGKAGADGEDVFSTVKGLSWGIPGTESRNNLIFFEEDGSFMLDISLEEYTGPLPLELKLEDYNNNINRRILLLKDGKRPPEITLSLPKEDSEYGAFLDITGIIKDPYAGTAFGGIEKAAYEIVSTDNYDIEPVTGQLELFENNSFGTQLPSFDMEGKQQLILSVKAVNGNSATHTVDLTKSSKGITSFSFTADENSLTADWRPIQATEAEYRLLITDDGSEPVPGSARVIANASPPLVLDNIGDGKIYSAKLLADTEYGLLESEALRAIPAGAETFGLKAKGAFKQIQLNWSDIPGAQTYSIFRTDDANKGFKLLTTGVFGDRFIDKDIAYGREYYYYITPEGHEYARSGYAGASMLKAPDERVIALNKLSDFSPVDIEVIGNYVYTAAGDDGLRIVDITSPESLSITGTLQDIKAFAVKVRGDYAYIAGGPEGLNIINIMDPGLPVLTGRRTTVDASDVSLKGNYAYIADNDSGLKVIDISDSTAPERITTITDIVSSKLFSTENLLFSNDTSSVRVFDITEPSNPVPFAEYPYAGIKDILVSENIAYLLSGQAGLIILDISTPETPELLSTFSLTDPEALALSGNFAYVADGRSGFKIIDVSSLETPASFDSLKTGRAVAVDISGENVIIAESTGLTAIQTFLQGVSFILNKILTAVTSTSVSIYKNLAFIPAREDGVITLDVSSPSSPVRLEPDTIPDYAGEIEVDGDNLYISTADNSVSQYELIPGQAAPVISGPSYTVELAAPVTSMRINVLEDNERILAVCTEDGMVSFIENGTVTGTIETIEGRDCVIKDGMAFISDNRAGLMIYKLETESGAPELSNSIEIERADFLLLYKNYLLAASRKGLFFYDITDPETPVSTGLIKTNYAENGIVQGDYLYLAEGYKGLTIYDLKDPLNPVLASVCDTVYAADLAIKDDYAFITDGTGFNTVRIFIPDWIK